MVIMEKVSIEFSVEELEKINKHRLENETIEAAVRRLLLSHISEIPDNIWSSHTQSVFDEFEETFQKLAE